MAYWQKERNYRKCANADGSVSYIITVDGTDVEVSAEVYRAYAQTDRRERYCTERETGLLLSLERMEDDGMPLGSFAIRVTSAEDIVMHQMLVAAALEALSRLAPEERRLIKAVVMGGVTEQEFAERIGITQKGVNKRKIRALKKMRKYFSDFGT